MKFLERFLEGCQRRVQVFQAQMFQLQPQLLQLFDQLIQLQHQSYLREPSVETLKFGVRTSMRTEQQQIKIACIENEECVQILKFIRVFKLFYCNFPNVCCLSKRRLMTFSIWIKADDVVWWLFNMFSQDSDLLLSLFHRD